MPITERPEFKTHPHIGDEKVQHAFFTRKGGVSTGLYRGLNIGVGSNDNQHDITENRNRAASAFGTEGSQILTPWQVHSPDAVIVNGPFGGERPMADGIVTATPGVLIGVVTADCGPILFSDPKANVIGAAHAGWKGAFYGVLENTLTAMESLGAKRGDIKAVLGPCISQPNYEVGPEFVSAFTRTEPNHDRFFIASTNAGHAMFDMWNFILHRLEKAGIEASVTGDCTYADEDNFYSFRRATHRKEVDYGRQLSAISIRSA